MNIKKDDEFLGVEGNFYEGDFYFDHINIEVPYSNELEQVYLEAASFDSSITLIERIESLTEVVDRTDPETVFPSYLVTRPHKQQIVVLIQSGVITAEMKKKMDQITGYASALGGEVIFVRSQNCSFEDEDEFRASYVTQESKADN